jgi:hypothetical protein
LYCCRTVEDKKFPFLQGGLIFKQHAHDQTWLKLRLCRDATLFIIRGYENQIVQHCLKDFNQSKSKFKTTLIYDDDFTKRSIPVNIPEKYGGLTQLFTEDNFTIYEICKNYHHIYQTYYKGLEKIAFERDHQERRGNT